MLMRKDLPGGTVCVAETQPTKLTLTLTFIFVFGFTLQGCRSETRTGALIEYSKIPPAAQGGRERVDTIAGRVIAARPGQRIVIYAKSGPWWVQPLPDNDQNYREMGIEIGRWGDRTAVHNARYDVQPFYVAGNVVPFTAPSGTLTHTLRWEAGRTTFETVRGPAVNGAGPLVSRHVFDSGISPPGKELFQFTLYLVASDKNPLEKETEVVVEKFEYLP